MALGKPLWLGILIIALIIPILLGTAFGSF